MNHLDVMKEAARAASPILTKYFGQVLEFEEKHNASDIRSQADVEAEKVIIDILKKHFPDYSILAEESGNHNHGAEYRFIVDPLDGTNNFSLGIPFFSTAIALMKNDVVIAAVTHQPLSQDTYWAERGSGAFHNGKQIHVSHETKLERLTCAHQLGYHNAQELAHVYFEKFSPRVKRVWLGWSPSLDYALLAAGKIDVIYGNGVELYDIAGGILLAEEAGAKIHIVNDSGVLQDKENIYLVTNTEVVRDEIMKFL